MTKKRRSGGRSKPPGARGHVKRVRCEASGVLVPKDKAVKRFIVRNIVDASAIRDIQDASTIESYALPKIYRKVYYSISAAIHSKIVRVRSRTERRNRVPPPRFRPPADRQPRYDAGGGGAPGGSAPGYGGGGGGSYERGGGRTGGGGYGGGGVGGVGGGGGGGTGLRHGGDDAFGGVPARAPAAPAAPANAGGGWAGTPGKAAAGPSWD